MQVIQVQGLVVVPIQEVLEAVAMQLIQLIGTVLLKNLTQAVSRLLSIK